MIILTCIIIMLFAQQKLMIFDRVIFSLSKRLKRYTHTLILVIIGYWVGSGGMSVGSCGIV